MLVLAPGQPCCCGTAETRDTAAAAGCARGEVCGLVALAPLLWWLGQLPFTCRAWLGLPCTGAAEGLPAVPGLPPWPWS